MKAADYPLFVPSEPVPAVVDDAIRACADLLGTVAIPDVTRTHHLGRKPSTVPLAAVAKTAWGRLTISTLYDIEDDSGGARWLVDLNLTVLAPKHPLGAELERLALVVRETHALAELMDKAIIVVGLLRERSLLAADFGRQP